MRADGVLANVRVLDFTEWLPGPYGGRPRASVEGPGRDREVHGHADRGKTRRLTPCRLT